MPEELVELERKILTILSVDNARECEKKLIALLNYEKFDLIKLLVKNRYIIFYGTRLQQAQSQSDKEAIISEMDKHA